MAFGVGRQGDRLVVAGGRGMETGLRGREALKPVDGLWGREALTLASRVRRHSDRPQV